MSTGSATYQVRIATAGSSTMSGNVDLTLAIDDLAGIPLIAGATVDPFRMVPVRQPFTVSAIVDDVLFTDGSDRLQVIGRLIDVQRNLDDAGFSTLATGRISGVSEGASRGRLEIAVSDSTWLSKGARLFETTDTIQLDPYGLRSAFMTFSAAGNRTYTVDQVTGNAVKLSPNTAPDAPPVSLRRALVNDLVPSADRDTSSTSTGNFTALRFDLDSGATPTGDRQVISFANNLGTGTAAGTILDEMAPGASGVLDTMWVQFGSGHGLSASDTVDGSLYFPSGIPSSENIPLHIGGASGIHPMTLAKNILDGDYGGEAQSYDSTSMTTLTGLSLTNVWLRVWGTGQGRAEWLAENIWRVYAVAPYIGTDLVMYPKEIKLPSGTSLVGLPSIGADDGAELTWEHPSRHLVTVVGLRDKRIESETYTTDDFPADDLKESEWDNGETENDNVSDVGEVFVEVVTQLSLDDSAVVPGDGAGVLSDLGDALFEVFGDGSQEGSIVLPENSGHEVGDLVFLDQDELKAFNADTGDRTDERLVRLTAFRYVSTAAIEFDYLDLGPGNTR